MLVLPLLIEIPEISTTGSAVLDGIGGLLIRLYDLIAGTGLERFIIGSS